MHRRSLASRRPSRRRFRARAGWMGLCLASSAAAAPSAPAPSGSTDHVAVTLSAARAVQARAVLTVEAPLAREWSVAASGGLGFFANAGFAAGETTVVEVGAQVRRYLERRVDRGGYFAGRGTQLWLDGAEARVDGSGQQVALLAGYKWRGADGMVADVGLGAGYTRTVLPGDDVAPQHALMPVFDLGVGWSF